MKQWEQWGVEGQGKRRLQRAHGGREQGGSGLEGGWGKKGCGAYATGPLNINI